MILENSAFKIEVCEETGATAGIYAGADNMNWVLNNSAWGLIDGFETKSVTQSGNAVIVNTFNSARNIEAVIEKKLCENEYFETYRITNKHVSEVFLTKENFGIPFSYDCLYDPKRDYMNECCISHIWCGGDCSWIYSVKCNGKAPYLVMNVTEGAVDDYSIKYDISRMNNGSFYRGAFLLHLRDTALMPNETASVTFRYSLSDTKPESLPLDYSGAIRFTADKYSVEKNEEISLLFESEKEIKSLKISCENKEIKYNISGKAAKAKISFDTLGERRITAELDGKVTWVNVNVILPVHELLLKRAKFITEKQQYTKKDSRLYGAYLVYDNQTKNLYYDSVWTDYNAGNERFGMGILVCRALQEKYDAKMHDSLKLHRAFIERELFDKATGMVYDNVGVKKDFPRPYNFPWLSTYYYEWYKLDGEIECLENSARILLKFYEKTGCRYGAQCVEAYKICEALKKEGLLSLYKQLFGQFITYVDGVYSEQVRHVNETSYVSEVPNQNLSYFSQAFLMSGDEKYLKAAEESLVKTKAFFAKQPDFHLNCVNVRYWDRYWFGKIKSYGDVFPHYWSTLAAWGMKWYEKASGSDACRRLIINNLLGNLCVYREDGFAHNNYLYPYKVIQYSPTGGRQNEYLAPGVFWGKAYDSYANDQDWALYYASCIL